MKKNITAQKCNYDFVSLYCELYCNDYSVQQTYTAQNEQNFV